jgi:hypothetical protein
VKRYVMGEIAGIMLEEVAEIMVQEICGESGGMELV